MKRFGAALSSCGALVVLAVVPAALAARSPGDPKLKHTAADVALATKALLTTKTLGAGWKTAGQSKARGGSSPLSCDSAVQPDESALTETGGAGSPLFVHAPYQAISQSVHVFSTEAQAETAWQKTLTSKLVICMEQRIESASAMGAPVSVTDWYRLPLMPLVHHVAGFRVVATAKAGKKQKTTVYLDLLLFGQGRTVTTLVFSSLKTPFANAFERQIERAVASPLNA